MTTLQYGSTFLFHGQVQLMRQPFQFFFLMDDLSVYVCLYMEALLDQLPFFAGVVLVIVLPIQVCTDALPLNKLSFSCPVWSWQTFSFSMHMLIIKYISCILGLASTVQRV